MSFESAAENNIKKGCEVKKNLRHASSFHEHLIVQDLFIRLFSDNCVRNFHQWTNVWLSIEVIKVKV